MSQPAAVVLIPYYNSHDVTCSLSDADASTVHDILKRIKDSDALALGFDPRWARPEWLVITCLPVAPPHVRPSVVQGSGMSHDDLTHQ